MRWLLLCLLLAGCGGGNTSTYYTQDGTEIRCQTWEYRGTHTECKPIPTRRN